MLAKIKNSVSNHLVRYLTHGASNYRTFSVYRTDELLSVLKPGDVLLVEGDQRISGAIKYLTQSTWSHAAMYVGSVPAKYLPRDTPALIEADLKQGVAAAPLSKYEGFNTRICRAHGLTDADRQTVVGYMIASLGKQYDLKNIIDLARYLLPTPPVPRRFRRQMLSLGSGDPTRAVCSSLIAQAFQLVRYPILPEVTCLPVNRSGHAEFTAKEILHIRHHSLFAPRDFDLSPYFVVIKPTLTAEFDYRALNWGDRGEHHNRHKQT